MNTLKPLPQLSLLACFVTFFSLTIHARRIQLFDNEVPHPYYDNMVSNLHNGDRLYFSNGRMFKVQDHTERNQLPYDERFARIGIGHGHVLLLPRHCSQPHTCSGYKTQLIRYVNGHRILSELRIPVPKLYLAESFLPEYLKQESIIPFDDLESASKSYLSGEYPFSAFFERHLRLFIRETALFHKIGGFSLKKVGLTLRGFVLMGWDDSHELYNGSSHESGSLLDEFPKDILIRNNDLARIVQEQRENVQCQQLIGARPKIHRSL